MMHFMPLFPKNCLQLVVRFSSNTPKMVDLRQVTTAEIIIRKNCAPDKVTHHCGCYSSNLPIQAIKQLLQWIKETS